MTPIWIEAKDARDLFLQLRRCVAIANQQPKATIPEQAHRKIIFYVSEEGRIKGCKLEEEQQIDFI